VAVHGAGAADHGAEAEVAAAAAVVVVAGDRRDPISIASVRSARMEVLPMKVRTAGWLVVLLVAVLGAASGCAQDSQSTKAPKARGQLFGSTNEAVDALIAALRAYDRAELARILGPNADDVISSGDEVADRNALRDFLDEYDAHHELQREPNGAYTLIVGPNDWPLPIPLVQDPARNAWYFDTDAGKEEIINRRVGRNELDTIQTCLALVDAEREYALRDPDGDGVRNYASKLRSDPGAKNGL
jgi:hypothetical protein